MVLQFLSLLQFSMPVSLLVFAWSFLSRLCYSRGNKFETNGERVVRELFGLPHACLFAVSVADSIDISQRSFLHRIFLSAWDRILDPYWLHLIFAPVAATGGKNGEKLQSHSRFGLRFPFSRDVPLLEKCSLFGLLNGLAVSGQNDSFNHLLSGESKRCASHYLGSKQSLTDKLLSVWLVMLIWIWYLQHDWRITAFGRDSHSLSVFV